MIGGGFAPPTQEVGYGGVEVLCCNIGIVCGLLVIGQNFCLLEDRMVLLWVCSAPSLPVH